MKKLIILVGIFLLTSCGSGGGGSSSEESSSDIPENESGFPDVAGTYATNINSWILTCTDGVKVVEEEMEPSSNIFTVTQTGNVLEMPSSAGQSEGINVESSTGHSCFVQKDSTFYCGGGSLTYTLDGIEGTITLTVIVNGVFTDNGWSGTDTVRYVFNSLGVICTGETTFSGDKF